MELTEKLLVLALFVQVALTMAILLLLGRERVPRIRRGEIAIADIAVDSSGWPHRARLFSNSFDSQFQLPVLFYAAGIVVLLAGTAGPVELALAWLFVVSRIAHASIHVTSNDVPMRFIAFCAGFFVLAALWAFTMLRILMLPGPA